MDLSECRDIEQHFNSFLLSPSSSVSKNAIVSAPLKCDLTSPTQTSFAHSLETGNGSKAVLP